MRINFTRINHVQVCIPRGAEADARDFYGRLLGLREIPKPSELRESGGVWFEMADIQLHVSVEDELARTKRHPAFEVEDIAGVRRYLEAQGVATRDERDAAGMRRFSLFDPFGNRIELMEKIKAAS
ncbi:MAG TPA: VOC family protein [Pyrinomonadaceae bacterium]|nr:VOC family protein [Pyrinomonadaceae bacterium]